MPFSLPARWALNPSIPPLTPSPPWLVRPHQAAVPTARAARRGSICPMAWRQTLRAMLMWPIPTTTRFARSPLACLAPTHGVADCPARPSSYLALGVESLASAYAFLVAGSLGAQSVYTTPDAVTTLAGAASSSGSDDGTGSAAHFFSPSGVAT